MAARRLDRELDVVHLIRRQFVMYGLLKALTTKMQRALVRRQYGLIVGDEREANTTEESGSDFEFPLTMDNDPVVQNLMAGLTKFKKKNKTNPNVNVVVDHDETAKSIINFYPATTFV
jgi:hypothetical protein